jgi:hypothetical protein
MPSFSEDSWTVDVQGDCSPLATDEMKLAARQTMEDTPDYLLSHFRGSDGVLTIRTIMFERNKSNTMLIYSGFFLSLSE